MLQRNALRRRETQVAWAVLREVGLSATDIARLRRDRRFGVNGAGGAG
jgi:hypothetical protein